jgi:hypothetical protein
MQRGVYILESINYLFADHYIFGKERWVVRVAGGACYKTLFVHSNYVMDIIYTLRTLLQQQLIRLVIFL